MPATIAEKRASFFRLHEAGCFVMPNPFDAGGARYLEQLGFKAIASSSAGFAWTIARGDGKTRCDEVIAHLKSLVAAVDLPVHADFEGGYAHEPAGVAANVSRAVETGVAGLSIEDFTGDPAAPFYSFEQAVARVKAARAAMGPGVLLTARSEGYFVGRPDLAETIRRLKAFAEAGADCLFAPGVKDEADHRAIIQAVTPKPVNVVMGNGSFSVAQLAGMGVRRISTGASLARVAWAAVMGAAKEIADKGSFAGFDRAAAGKDLNALFK